MHSLEWVSQRGRFLIGWRVESVGVSDGRGVGHKRWKLEINSES